MARGVLNNKVQEVALKHLGRGISKTELRLMPFVMVNTMDNTVLKRQYINTDDRAVLKLWGDEELIKLDGLTVHLTKKFYRVMCEILLVGYCSDHIL